MDREIEMLLAREHAVPTRRLRALGLSDHEIRSLVGRGALVRLRHGWLGSSRTPVAVASAVRAGGALTCLHALSLAGAWVPPSLPHVRRSKRFASTPCAAPLPCGPRGDHRPVTRAVDPTPLAFASLLSCGSDEDVVVVADSLLHSHLAELPELVDVVRQVRPARARLLELVDPRADSGLESMVRLRLRARGHKVRSQVLVEGVGQVDLLVDGWYVIETDGRAHHQNFESDRRRDLTRDALGLRGARLTYRMVVHDWPATERKLRQALAFRTPLKCSGFRAS